MLKCQCQGCCLMSGSLFISLINQSTFSMEMVVPAATSLGMPSTALLTQPENDSYSFCVFIINYNTCKGPSTIYQW